MVDYRIVAAIHTKGPLGGLFDANHQALGPQDKHPADVKREVEFAQRLIDNRNAVLLALSAATGAKMSPEQQDMVKRLIRLLRA